MLTSGTHRALVHALVLADRRQKTNPYALSHYLKALKHVEQDVDERSLSLRDALKQRYCGPLVNRLVKAAGLASLTPDEIREVR